jgi:hypothetical protein
LEVQGVVMVFERAEFAVVETEQIEGEVGGSLVV